MSGYALEEILLLAVGIAVIAPIGVEVLVEVIPAIDASPSPWGSFLVRATIAVLVLAEVILLLLLVPVVLSAFGDGEIGVGIAGIGVLALLVLSLGHVAVAISGAGGGEAGHIATHGSAANTTNDNQDQTSWILRLLRILYGCPVPTYSIFWPGSAVCK